MIRLGSLKIILAIQDVLPGPMVVVPLSEQMWEGWVDDKDTLPHGYHWHFVVWRCVP